MGAASEMVSGLLGILKAGAAYACCSILVLEAIVSSYMLQEAAVPIILTQARLEAGCRRAPHRSCGWMRTGPRLRLHPEENLSRTCRASASQRM